MLVSIFYAIPSFQYVFFQLNRTHDIQKTCFFNYKCAHHFGSIYAFNNFISNIFYVIFGIFVYIIYYFTSGEDNTVYRKNGLFVSIILSMTLEGIFSSLYHICPSSVNFQFDTTYMIMFSVFILILVVLDRLKN